MTAEVHVVRHLLGQEPAVRGADGEAPRIERGLDDQVRRPECQAPLRLREGPGPRGRSRDDVAEPLGGSDGTRRHPDPDDPRRDRADGHAGGGETLRDQGELDAVRRPLPAQCPPDAHVPRLHHRPPWREG